MLEIIIAGLFIMLASLSGILFTQRFAASFLHRKLDLLVSFSAGVFLVTAGSLVIEVFHITESIIYTISLTAIGYIAAALLHRLLPETHHHHDDHCGEKRGAKKILVGDAIHNVADGIILVPAFLISGGLGMVVALSIFIHEFLQEVAEFFILKRAGYSTKMALTINFLVSSTLFIGIAIGYFALGTESLEAILLAISGGFFLHVVAHDLLPNKSGHGHQSSMAMVAIGAVLMLGVNTLLSEEHTHEELQGEVR